MKLQNMAIILIIIVLPITLIISAYTRIQIDTISVQTMYTTKLKDATFDAISAFELNTNKNDYSTVSDSMRRDVSAAVETFMKSVAMNWGMSGANEEYIKPYIPAIVFTLYDGYYIYAPSFTYDLNEHGDDVEDGYTSTGKTTTKTVTDSNGNDKELVVSGHIDTWTTETAIEKTKNGGSKGKYEHVLKPYIYYTVRYVPEGEDTDIIVNYSLDNYIVIYGKLKGEYVTKAGYLVNPDKDPNINPNEELIKRLPVTTITYTDLDKEGNPITNKSTINDQAIYGVQVKDVNVTSEKLLVDRLNNAFDSEFINSVISTNSLYLSTGRIHIDKSIIEAKAGLNKKYYAVNKYLDGITYPTYYAEGDYKVGWYIDPNSQNYYVDSQSANKYYVGDDDQYEGALKFTKWVNENMSNIKASDARKSDGTPYTEFSGHQIFKIDSSNDPQDEGSIFNNHRREVIKQSIEDNLSQAMESYNQNSEALGTTYNFKMPRLSEKEWDQVISNVCMISFMQGVQAGTKVYNNYTIVTSTKNKEFISNDSIYYINTEGGDGKYHKLGCSHLVDNDKIVGYRNSEFDRMSFEYEDFQRDKNGNPMKDGQGHSLFEDKTEFYYMHENEACYYCIVNSTKER